MKRLIISLVVSLGLLGGLLTPLTVVPTYAQTPEEAVCEGIELTGGNCGPGAETRVSDTIKVVINIFSIIVGFAAVIMVIVGGFKYVTSSGDPAGVNSAKNTILFAIVGLVIVALAQVIVRFVVDRIKTSP